MIDRKVQLRRMRFVDAMVEASRFRNFEPLVVLRQYGPIGHREVPRFIKVKKEPRFEDWD
jgi:hypothetical protein